MGYSVKAVHPGPRASDPYDWRVEIEESTLPWPLVFHFARRDEDDGSSQWINVGFELRRAGVIDESTAPESVVEVDPIALEDIALRYDRFLRIARDALEFDFSRAVKRTAELRAKARGRRALTAPFFERVAEEYAYQTRRKHAAVSEIARAHGVNRSTASRWVARCRELGYLEGEDESNGS